MAQRKLSKKTFEQLLNEKASSLDGQLDLEGFDDFFEAWKLNSRLGFGTWLRRLGAPNEGLEFKRRYEIWLETHA